MIAYCVLILLCAFLKVFVCFSLKLIDYPIGLFLLFCFFSDVWFELWEYIRKFFLVEDLLRGFEMLFLRAALRLDFLPLTPSIAARSFELITGWWGLIGLLSTLKELVDRPLESNDTVRYFLLVADFDFYYDFSLFSYWALGLRTVFLERPLLCSVFDPLGKS